jgi:hypothetical protein
MKKLFNLLLFIAFYFSKDDLNAQPQCYLQLYPDDNSKIVFQILVDRNYSDVAIYVNFYNSQGQPIKLNKKFFVTNEANKYLRPDNGVYSFIFDHPFKDVDHVTIGGILEKLAMLGFDGAWNKDKNAIDDGQLAHDKPWGKMVNPVNSPNALGTIPDRPKKQVTFLQATTHYGVIIHSSWHCDLKTGVQATDGDFQWNLDTPPGSIIPNNGARFFLMWNCPDCFDTLSYAALLDYDQRGLMTSAAISTAHVPAGSLVAFITRNNIYGVLKIDAYIKGRGTDLKYSSRAFGN